MNVFAIDYDKEIKRAKNNFKNLVQQGWTENPKPTQVKGTSLVTLRDREGVNMFVGLFPQTRAPSFWTNTL